MSDRAQRRGNPKTPKTALQKVGGPDDTLSKRILTAVRVRGDSETVVYGFPDESVILPVSQLEGDLIKDFYLVSSHGAVVFYIAVNPDCTIGDIAESMALTRRTVWGLIGDLRRAGMLHVRKQGRRHHYTIDLDAPFLHPSVNGYALRALFGQITAPAGERSGIS